MWCSFQNDAVCVNKAPSLLFLDVKAPVGALEDRAGARGNQSEDVRLVQRLLNMLSASVGGAEKSLDEDGKIGPLTKGAIKTFQRKQFPDKNPDSIVDPQKRTIYRLNVLCFPGVDEELLRLARESIPKTHSYVLAAIHQLELVRDSLNSPISNPLFSNSRATRLVNENFHLSKSTDPSRDIDQILSVYSNMNMILGHQAAGPNQKPAFGFIDTQPTADSASPPLAYAFAGGYHDKGQLVKPKDGPIQSQGTIYLTRILLKAVEGTTIYAIIHELAHYVGGKKSDIDYIDDRAYWHRQKPKYDRLTTFESYTNADCFSQFAWMVRHDNHFTPVPLKS